MVGVKAIVLTDGIRLAHPGIGGPMFKVVFLENGWSSTETPDPVTEWFRTPIIEQAIRLVKAYHPGCTILSIELENDDASVSG
jgi:hypothetical protein